VPDKLHPGPGMDASDVAAHQSARIHRAMIEVVADQGYEAVKVRELVHLAGVSSAAFYKNFTSKEDCFLRTHDLVVRRATRRIIASQTGEGDWRKRPRLVFDAFVHELQDDPDAAHFALIEAYAVGPAALTQARKAEATFEAMFAQSFARAPGGMVVPAMVVEGTMAGVAGVAKAHLLSGREAKLAHLNEEMEDWMLSYPGASADELAHLDLQLVWRDTRLQPLASPSSSGEGEAWPKTGDRALLLASVAELTAANGYGALTATSISRGAGLPRAIFKSLFEDVEGCFIAAMEQRAGEALAQAARAQTAGRTWAGGTYRAISALCDQLIGDPLLTGVCLAEAFEPDSNGSRSRAQLIAAVAELLNDSAPLAEQPSALFSEASTSAVWALFHHHLIRALPLSSPQIAATLAFMALAPVIGAPATAAAIAAEQNEY
jgi:AcrR family transcriptional regulator